jgi:phosphatidate cytidylyltransferase
MNLLFLVIAVHFILGASGILFLNRKLSGEQRRKNWLKYFLYLMIFIIVLTSSLVNKNLFLAVTIIISSIGLFELLKLGKQPVRSISRNRIFAITLIVFSVIVFFFSVFVLLPSVIIAYTYTLVVVFDGASQISGQIAGKRKILPALSPDKTWAGLFGGALSAIITSVVLHDFAGISVLQSLLFGLLVCFASFVGDMTASAYKRIFGVKDFGNYLPGQGGVLDRFDSFLTSGAAVGLLSIMTCYSVSSINLNIAIYLGFSLAYVAVLLIGELIYFIFQLKPEYSRVFSHIMAGIISLLMIMLFTSGWYIVSLCMQSAVFLLLTKKLELLGSHHKVERYTNGSSIFFVGILTAYLLSKLTAQISVYLIAVAVLTISDPVASVTGMKCRSGFWPGSSANGSPKTFIGSAGFLISTLLILFAGLSYFYHLSGSELIIFSVLISLLTTIAEAYSPNGTDNFTIPLVVSVSLTLFSM